MHILGIDPGINGSYALFKEMVPIFVRDLPHVYGSLIMQPLLKDLLETIGFQPLLVIVEEQQHRPPSGGKASFTLGMNYGRLLTYLEIYSKGQYAWQVYPVKPTSWKKSMHLTSDKERSRAMALTRWPALANELSQKKHHDRAEALLLAAYGYQFVYKGNGV